MFSVNLFSVNCYFICSPFFFICSPFFFGFFRVFFMPFNVNWPKATEAFADWENQVRRKWFFHKLKNKEEKEEIEENSWYE